jgi:hypothetical protein
VADLQAKLADACRATESARSDAAAAHARAEEAEARLAGAAQAAEERGAEQAKAAEARRAADEAEVQRLRQELAAALMQVLAEPLFPLVDATPPHTYDAHTVTPRGARRRPNKQRGWPGWR